MWPTRSIRGICLGAMRNIARMNMSIKRESVLDNPVDALRRANQAFQQGDFLQAVRLYLEKSEAFPEFAHFDAFNVALARKHAQRCYSASSAAFEECRRAKRAVIFATYSSTGKVEEYVLHYLRHLRKVAGYIVVIGDFAVDAAEVQKLDGLADHSIFERHGEYDFGSYKRGYVHLKNTGFLDQVDELIVCNDSCYGPLQGFFWMFQEMAARQVDFWGLTQNSHFFDHVQSYFLVLTRKVFLSADFDRFIQSVERQDSVHEVIQKYELGLTRTLAEAGFVWDTFINPHSPGMQPLLKINSNPTVFPNFLLDAGAQLVKVKALKDPTCNADLIYTTLGKIARENIDLLRFVCAHGSKPVWYRQDIPFFSVIMPAFNREQSIALAIDSLLAQDFDNYELIVVDDGSADNTSAMLHERYKAQIEQCRIRLIGYKKNAGVSAARNIGLAAAQGEWIAYLDSDNILEKDFFKIFSSEIQTCPDIEFFYAMRRSSMTKQDLGCDFDYQKLLQGNYIDLGVIAHRKKIVEETGGFDTSLRRLVDWDFLIRTMRNRKVQYIPKVVLHYYDDPASTDRISVRESYDVALRHIRQKNNLSFLLSTVVLPNGNAEEVVAAIDGACSAALSHRHEVLLFDNSGNDALWAAIGRSALRYPMLRSAKLGSTVSEHQAFLSAVGAARGDFVRVLPAGGPSVGDDVLQQCIDELINKPDNPQVVLGGQAYPEHAMPQQGQGVLQFAGVLYRRHVLEKLLRLGKT